jgi:hypothetical protein
LKTRVELDTETIPFVERALQIWEEWDLTGKPCPHNKNGWLAFHQNLAHEQMLKETA